MNSRTNQLVKSEKVKVKNKRETNGQRQMDRDERTKSRTDKESKSQRDKESINLTYPTYPMTKDK